MLLDRLGGAVYEQPPETLSQDGGFVGVLAALHKDRAIAVEGMNRESVGVLGWNRVSSRRQRSVIVTKNDAR